MTDAILIRARNEVSGQMDRVRESARLAHVWIAQQSGDPIEFLKNVKFEKKGFHPITGHRLNLIEQVNQTFTYMVALRATELLLDWHPESEGYNLAPGATASQALDIMSVRPGFVGAETFAATSPKSNNKLDNDLKKLSGRSEVHRYVFMSCPCFPKTEWRSEDRGISVWSIAV